MTATRPPVPRHMQLELRLLDDGRIRVSTPQARGHAAVARGPLQLWAAVAACFREAAVAGHSRWRGERYDLDAMTERDDPTEPAQQPMPGADDLAARRGDPCAAVGYGRGRVTRPDQANPADWTPSADGSWTSPSGRRWTSPAILAPLLIKRGKLGLSTSHAEWVAEQAQQREAQAG